MPAATVITVFSIVQVNWSDRAGSDPSDSQMLRFAHADANRRGSTYARLDRENLIGAYAVTGAALRRRSVPGAGYAAILQMDVTFEDWDGCIQACKDAYDPRVDVILDGRDLLDYVKAWHETPVRLGETQAQILVLERPPGLDTTGRDFDPRTDVDAALLRQLLIKDVDIRYRPEYTPITVPDDINGPVGTFVAVWATNTVVSGYADRLRNRIEDLVGAATLVVVTGELCLYLIGEARRQFSTRTPAGVTEEAWANERAKALSELQVLYTFGVEAHLPALVPTGGRPVESYHRALAREMGVSDRARVTAGLIDRLAEALRADRDLASLTATLKGARTTRQATVVVGSLVPVLTAVLLFAGMATIPSRGTVVTPLARAAAASGLIVVGAGGLGYLLSRSAVQASGRSRSSSRKARMAVVAAAGLAALVLLVLVVDGAVKERVGWDLIAVSAALLIFAVVFLGRIVLGDVAPEAEPRRQDERGLHHERRTHKKAAKTSVRNGRAESETQSR